MGRLGAWSVVLMLMGGCSGPESPSAPASTTPEADGARPLVQPSDADTLRIGLASSAKRLCSGVFVAGVDRETVMAQELEDSAGEGIGFVIQDDPAAVVASAAGERALVLYRPYLGCTLVDADRVDELLDQFDPAAPPVAELNPDAPWPQGHRVELLTEVEGLDLDAVNAAIDAAFAEQRMRTRAVVVVHDGRIVAERYAEPFDADTPQLGWSMTKTVTNALTGLLVGGGVLKLDAPAPVPEWQSPNDPRRQITLDQLLRMSSGLAFSEVYTVESSSDVVQMLFGAGHEDMGAFTANMPLAHPPGTHWSYASGTTNLIARLHRKSFDSLREYLAFPHKRLFSKLGMTSAVMEPDVSGTFVGSSYLYATPRDWARLGLLYLQDGVWNGERILPEGWVEYSLQPAPAAEQGQYGAQIWLNRGPEGHPEQRPHPELPPEMFYLSGFEGQNVVVLPSHGLVVARLGLTRSDPGPIWTLTRSVLDALR